MEARLVPGWEVTHCLNYLSYPSQKAFLNSLNGWYPIWSGMQDGWVQDSTATYTARPWNHSVMLNTLWCLGFCFSSSSVRLKFADRSSPISTKAPGSILSTNLWGTGGSVAPRKLAVGGSFVDLSVSGGCSLAALSLGDHSLASLSLGDRWLT